MNGDEGMGIDRKDENEIGMALAIPICLTLLRRGIVTPFGMQNFQSIFARFRLSCERTISSFCGLG